MLERDDIEEIWRTWQRRLGLEGWDVTFEWDHPIFGDDTAHAEIWRSNSYDTVRVRFNSDFTTWSRARANKHVVHELCHLMTRDLDQAVESAEAIVSRDAYKLLESRYSHEVEGVVDRLAVRFVDLAGVV